MPWLSRHARAGIAVLIDRDQLPADGAQDREELTRIGVQSLIGTAFISRGQMFGSFSVGSIVRPARGLEPWWRISAC